MKRFLVNSAKVGLGLVMVLGVAQSSYATLLLHYEFETVDGTHPNMTTPDSSGLGNTGNLGGGATVGFDYPSIDVGNGPDGSNSMHFFGSPNRVEVPDGDADFDTSYSEFTFAAWVNPDELTTSGRVVASKMGGGGNRGWFLQRNASSNDLYIDYFDGGSGTEHEITVPNVFTDNAWTHLAVVFDANDFVKVYVNGSLVLNETSGVLSAWNGSNNVALEIGSRLSGSSWTGWMDDVRIYDNALSGAEVSALVPEPTGLFLAVMGLIALAATRRKR